MTVGEMQERMSNREFIQWKAFYARRAQQNQLEQNKPRK